MNGSIENGELFDAALKIVGSYEFNLDTLQWYEITSGMRIDYHYDIMTNGLSLIVYGLPYDIPAEIFMDLLDHMIKTKIKGERKADVTNRTKQWLGDYRSKKKALA